MPSKKHLPRLQTFRRSSRNRFLTSKQLYLDLQNQQAVQEHSVDTNSVYERTKLLSIIKAFGSRMATKINSSEDSLDKITSMIEKEKHISADSLENFDSNIELWIDIVFKAAFNNSTNKVDSSRVLAQMFHWIAEFESHPLPKDCINALSYVDIYRALGDLMLGEIPKEMNHESQKRLADLFKSLMARLSFLHPSIAEHTSFFESFSMLFNQIQKSPSNHDSVFRNYDTNPLQMPIQMITKRMDVARSKLKK